MFKKIENGDSTKPLELEFNGNTVYVRKDFKFIEAVESEEHMMSRPAHWEYLELQMTKAEYEIYKLETTIAEQDELLAMLLLGE